MILRAAGPKGFLTMVLPPTGSPGKRGGLPFGKENGVKIYWAVLCKRGFGLFILQRLRIISTLHCGGMCPQHFPPFSFLVLILNEYLLFILKETAA